MFWGGAHWGKYKVTNQWSVWCLCLLFFLNVRFAEAGVFQGRANMIVDVPSEEDKRATHVIDTPVQTMYIMADLTSSGG